MRKEVQMNYLEFVETRIFSQQRKLIMEDNEFQLFQAFLLENYEYGDVISRSGGCGKIRWRALNKGKRGGVRVIYYNRTMSGRLYLLTIYTKNAKEDLNEQEKAILRAIIQKLA
ncbi:type II toxin-antitoxin system RelE/ParE family toxin [Escherichia coli]|nr:type II toxin-antitoxin system RelE/ParE family toxin [Escherichia coli]